MRFDILTIFPEIFESYFNESMVKIAKEKKIIEIHIHNIRDYSKDKHKKVDDVPFGGGAGMVMTPQPLFDCIKAVKKLNSGKVIYMSPKGKMLTQVKVEKFSNKREDLIILCGRYEGIDERIKTLLIDEEISIGKYVLTGGEIPAMIMVDSIMRLLPGGLGKDESHQEDSFSKSLDRKKEYPHYTRPSSFEGLNVPDVLLSGNHKEIEKWRKNNLT